MGGFCFGTGVAGLTRFQAINNLTLPLRLMGCFHRCSANVVKAV